MAMKKGKTAFQRRFATQGEIVVDYFARLARRGGQAKGRNHEGPAWQELLSEAYMLYDNQYAVSTGR